MTTFVLIYLACAIIALLVLLLHVRLVDEPNLRDLVIVLVACVLFAAMWPSLLAGVFAGKWLKEADNEQE